MQLRCVKIGVTGKTCLRGGIDNITWIEIG